MIKTITRLVVFILLATAAIWLLQKLKVIPNAHDIFAAKPVEIDKTPILIKDIRQMAQLVTMVAYDEVVADSIESSTAANLINSINTASRLPILPSAQKKLVLIGRGKVLAGIELGTFSEENITVVGDTATLYLNSAVILDAVMNPSDFEVFEEKGKWSDEAVQAVKVNARNTMIARALDQNILAKADAKAKAVMESFVLSAGFKKVNVLTK